MYRAASVIISTLRFRLLDMINHVIKSLITCEALFFFIPGINCLSCCKSFSIYLLSFPDEDMIFCLQSSCSPFDGRNTNGRKKRREEKPKFPRLNGRRRRRRREYIIKKKRNICNIWRIASVSFQRVIRDVRISAFKNQKMRWCKIY